MAMARRQAEYDAFVRRLRLARRRAGLTQIDVAKRLGRPQSWVSNCESGQKMVDVMELRDLAKLYGRPITYFYEAD